MKLTICIGSSCHLKGSAQVVEQLTRLLAEHQLEDTVELEGSFCMGNCVSGVCVKLDDTFFSVSGTQVQSFFQAEVLPRL